MFQKRRKKKLSGQTLLSFFNKVEVKRPSGFKPIDADDGCRSVCESPEAVSSVDSWDEEDDDCGSNGCESTGLWYEDFRPRCLEDAVFHKDVTKIIHQLIRILGSKTMGVHCKVHSLEVYGHSGCGKTLLARLLAQACGCEFREVGLADMTVDEFHTEVLSYVLTNRIGPPCCVVVSGCEFKDEAPSNIKTAFDYIEKTINAESAQCKGRGIVVFERTDQLKKINKQATGSIGINEVSCADFISAVTKTLQRVPGVTCPENGVMEPLYALCKGDCRLGLNMLQWMQCQNGSWEGNLENNKCDERRNVFELMRDLFQQKNVEECMDKGVFDSLGSGDFTLDLMQQNVPKLVLNRGVIAPVSTLAECCGCVSDADHMCKTNLWNPMGVPDVVNTTGVVQPLVNIVGKCQGGYQIRTQPEMTRVLTMNSQKSINKKAKIHALGVGDPIDGFTHTSRLNDVEMFGGMSVARWTPLLEFARHMNPNKSTLVTSRQLVDRVHHMAVCKHNAVFNPKKRVDSFKPSKNKQLEWIQTTLDVALTN